MASNVEIKIKEMIKEVRMQFNLDSVALFKFLEDKVKVQPD
jgi:hypothetical protein